MASLPAGLPCAQMGAGSSRRIKVGLGLLVLICLAASGSEAADGRKPNRLVKVCKTPACLQAARFLLQRVDSTVQPCDDFYQFACGKWEAEQVLGVDEQERSATSEANGALQAQLRLLLETREPAGREAKFAVNLKNFYASCMDTQKLDALGSKPLLSLIAQLGGFPVLGNWNQSDFAWTQQLISLSWFGMSDMIIKVGVSPDGANNVKNIIEIDQASLGIGDRDRLFEGPDDPTVDLYYQLLVQSAILLGAQEAQANEQMFEVLQFEVELARHSRSRDERMNQRNPYNKLSVRELQRMAPNTNWLGLLNLIVGRPAGVSFNEDEPVNVKDPHYVHAIDELLRVTNPRTIANYLMSRVVLDAVPFLGGSWRALANLHSRVKRTGQYRDRWRKCVDMLNEPPINGALLALYARNVSQPEQRHYVRKMTSHVRQQFVRSLEQADWLDAATRARALVKASAMVEFLGAPDELLDDEFVNGMYKSPGELKVDDLFENALRLDRFKLEFEYKLLRAKNDRSKWRPHDSSLEINAVHFSRFNSLEISAALLQQPFFNRHKPTYMNFAGVGEIFGHEMGHGFDNNGREYDERGQRNDWWTPEARAAFQKRAECFVNQYGNYTVPSLGQKVNGQLTLGDNIADNAGVKAAFHAYRNYLEAAGGDLGRLPGLEWLSEEQLFWVSWASLWCAKKRLDYESESLATSRHAPERFRTNGPASNSEEFASVFECKLGSPMNPASKCSLW